MKRIGIIGAMAVEIAALKEEMKQTEECTVAAMHFCSGEIYGVPVVVVQSGIGKVNAGMCTQILADLFDVSCVINTGVAGSLDKRIHIGDFVIATDLVQYDVNATVFGYQKGEIPQMHRLSFPTDEKLAEELTAAVKKAAPEIGVFRGRIISGDRFIATQEEKNSLAPFQGMCCEMESAAIAQAAFLNNIPCAIIRAISDQADESVKISYDEFEGIAAKHCADMVLCYLKGLADGN